MFVFTNFNIVQNTHVLSDCSESAKVILLRGEDIVSGRRYEFRELRRLRRLKENVNNVALGCLYGLKLQKPFYLKHLLPEP